MFNNASPQPPLQSLQSHPAPAEAERPQNATAENLTASQYFMEQMNAGINGVFDAIISPPPPPPVPDAPSARHQPSISATPASDERIRELESSLQASKLQNNSLSAQVCQQRSIIEGLTAELQSAKSVDSASDAASIEKLRTELAAHTQTVSVLVNEKADLTAKTGRMQLQINEYETANIELQARLNASRHRVTELERDLAALQQTKQQFDGSQQALCGELEALQDENKRLRRLHQEACDETTEAQHQLSLKAVEIELLKQTVDERVKDVEMLQLRVEQLTAGDLIRHEAGAGAERRQQQADHSEYERQIIELQSTVSELSGDRDRLQQQYQTYVQHLTKEAAGLQQRIQELSAANEKLTKREESLVSHVSDLERQFQKQLSTQQRLAALRDDAPPKAEPNGNHPHDGELVAELREQLLSLEKQKSDLNVSRSSSFPPNEFQTLISPLQNLIEDSGKQNELLKQQMLEKDDRLASLETVVERLRAETPDTTTILATIESDKVAASRAVAQNQALKEQLDEIQKAYVQVVISEDHFPFSLCSHSAIRMF